MKKILFLTLIFSLFSCNKKDYNEKKLFSALINHSYYNISKEKANEIAKKGEKALKEIDENASFINFKGKILNKKENKELILYYPLIFKTYKDGIYAIKVFDYSIINEAGLITGSKFKSINNKSALEIKNNLYLLKDLLNTGQVLNSEYYNKEDLVKKIEINKEIPYIPFVWSYKINDNLAYVKIMSLSFKISEYFKNNILNLRKSNTKEIILDLRYLSSGDFEEVAKIVSYFIEENKPIYFINSDKKGYSREFYSKGSPIFKDLKLKILVNSKTASLAEILAEILRINLDAKIIGERTSGKFYILRNFKIGEHKGLKLSIAKLFIDKNIDLKEGFNPDYYVKDESSPNGINYIVEEDPVLMKAIEISEKVENKI